jgi:hypothetical protein
MQNIIYEKEENRQDKGRKYAVENSKDAKNLEIHTYCTASV